MRAILDTVIIKEVKTTKTKSGIALSKPIIRFIVEDFGDRASELLEELQPGDQAILRHDTEVTGFLGADQKSEFGAIRASDIVVTIPKEQIK